MWALAPTPMMQHGLLPGTRLRNCVRFRRSPQAHSGPLAWSPTSTKQRCCTRGSSGSTAALPWRSSSSFHASVSVWGRGARQAV